MDLGNRWYDRNPKVSIAVGCIEKADPVMRGRLAKLIIKYAMSMNVTAKRPPVGFFRRWYDKDPNLSLALEYFKNCNDQQQLQIAERIMDCVKNASFLP